MYCKLAILLKKSNISYFIFQLVYRYRYRGSIRIRIWLGIEMESWIRIHNIVNVIVSNARVATGVQSQKKTWTYSPRILCDKDACDLLHVGRQLTQEIVPISINSRKHKKSNVMSRVSNEKTLCRYGYWYWFFPCGPEEAISASEGSQRREREVLQENRLRSVLHTYRSDWLPKVNGAVPTSKS